MFTFTTKIWAKTIISEEEKKLVVMTTSGEFFFLFSSLLSKSKLQLIKSTRNVEELETIPSENTVGPFDGQRTADDFSRYL